MERWTAKLLTLFGTFLLPLALTLLPYKVSGCVNRNGSSGKKTLSYLMCLGGGIFFGTYLLHMGPEVQDIMKRSLLDPYCITYPIAELIVGVGFFLVLFAEKIVLRWNKRRIRRKRLKTCRKQSVDVEHSLSHPQVEMKTVGVKDIHCVSSEEACDECLAGKPCSGLDEMNHSETAELNPLKLPFSAPAHHTTMIQIDKSKLDLVDIEDLSSCAGAITDRTACPMSGTGECCSDPPMISSDWSQKEKHIVITMKVDSELNKQPAVSQSVVALETCKNDDTESAVASHGHHHSTRSIILILALSLHRIFEGMSIGLQDSVINVASLFGAVMCHEMVIGFSLGLQFVKSNFDLRRLLITSLVCSSIMPVGVLIGLVMTESGTDDKYVEIANGVLQAIAMGTFIYVTFFEILQEEVDPEDTSLGKIFCILVGFAMMALLDLIPEEQQVGPVHIKVYNCSIHPSVVEVVNVTGMVSGL